MRFLPCGSPSVDGRGAKHVNPPAPACKASCAALQATSDSEDDEYLFERAATMRLGQPEQGRALLDVNRTQAAGAAASLAAPAGASALLPAPPARAQAGAAEAPAGATGVEAPPARAARAPKESKGAGLGRPKVRCSCTCLIYTYLANRNMGKTVSNHCRRGRRRAPARSARPHRSPPRRPRRRAASRQRSSCPLCNAELSCIMMLHASVCSQAPFADTQISLTRLVCLPSSCVSCWNRFLPCGCSSMGG